jgi:phosphate transport system substrate-binding protein
MIQKILIFSISALLFLTCSHQPPAKTKYIRLQGSDTMYILALRWAEEYMRHHPDISVYVEGGGSARGFQALIKAEIDICASSRPMLPFEVRQLAEKHQRLGIAHLVAKDALSIYLHPANLIKNLSRTQLKDIFTGKIENWKEIGGKDQSILVLIRSPNSGTYLYFKEHVLLNEDYTDNSKIHYSTQSVVDAVSENENAIGYGGTAYGDKVLHCKIDGIEPTINNVIHDIYPIARYLYLYTLDTPKGHIKDFIDWILDMPGQVIVAKVGYIPLFQTETSHLP